MKKVIASVALILLPISVADREIFVAQKRHTEPVDRLVRAIYLAEGGAMAQHKYGIVSVRYRNADEARQICRRTVLNTYKRWKADGKPGTFLEYLSARYCPIGAENDPRGLNRYWLKNVRYFLSKNA